MKALAPTIVAIATVTILLALSSGKIKNGVDLLSEPLIAVAVGFVLGPHALGWVTPGATHHALEWVAKITVALAVIAGVLRLSSGYLRSSYKEILFLISGVLLVMWAASAGLAWLTLPVSGLTALLLGAAVTPTDPVLAGSIVSSRAAKQNIPERLRLLLTAESAANDGLAFLVVVLPLHLLTGAFDGVGPFVLHVVLWEVLGAIAIGAAIGGLAGKAARAAKARQWTTQTALYGLSVALTLGLVMLGELLGFDGILAVFGAGVGLVLWSSTEVDETEDVFDEGLKRLFEQPMFFLLGVALPLAGWAELGWPGLAFAALVLALRRPPWMFALSFALPSLRRVRDKAYVGWFGPIGIAALYYALMAERHTGDATLWHATSLVVLASVVAHGVTATPIAQRFGGRAPRRRRAFE